MGNLPSGTVTFLFTDIEGSTKLAHAHPEAWETARARHHAILREAIESSNGYVFQIIGDAFCASFHSAEDAFKSAVQSQTNLQKNEWGDTPIKVRMGLHTGKAEVQEDGQYQGYIALSLVQRIISCGHGNQVLLSGATENLLRGQLPEGVDLLDLGRHNFKGVPQAVRVFQVNAPGLERDFLPLRTFDILPNNLPAQLTSFVGREKELGDVKRLLKDTHMLTLIGPGGTGKTRLSIQAANDVLSQYPDGIWLVDLAPILDPLLVPRTTAISIGLRQEPQRPVIDMLCDYLAKKKMLIILDNCEHLVDACAQMADCIMHAASDVQILASSREALGIAGEVTYRVPSLGLPDVDNLPALDSLSQYEAVKLFIDRTSAAIPDFKVTNANAPALAQICHRLDGIPLAIELAAGKIRVLGLDQLAKRLDDRFKLLTGGSRTAMERHQTLRATVDWSYNLLPPEEQILFRRLAVFLGGWTLEAAESVCGDEPGSSSVGSDDVLNILEQLINKSLVVTEDEGGTSRYRMLETIRQYANEKLVDSGESEGLRDRHLDFFLNLAKTAEPHLYRHEQLEWLAQLDADHENLRGALELALSKESAESSLRMCAALGMYWNIRGYWIEGSKWLSKAFAKPANNNDLNEVSARARALISDADLADCIDDLERMKESSNLGYEFSQIAGKPLEIAIAKYYVGREKFRRHWNSHEALTLIEQCIKEFHTMNAVYWKARSFQLKEYLLQNIEGTSYHSSLQGTLELAYQAGERAFLGYILSRRASVMLNYHNRLNECLELAKQGDMFCKQVGTPMNEATIIFAELAIIKGEYEQAEQLYQELRERFDLLGEKNHLEQAMFNVGRVALLGGELAKARKYLEDTLTIARQENEHFWMMFSLGFLSNPAFYDSGDHTFIKRVNEGARITKGLSIYQKHLFLMSLLMGFRLYNPKITAMILGTQENMQRNNDRAMDWASNQYFYDHAEAHSREVLGDEGFESAFEEGLKLSLDDALDLVLKSVEYVKTSQ
ncbi:MAG TPA: adenylate/guanylate cyclase domain-containing protein [Anaerolineales bacterium]|nr:adenylate/guanylate cyclase domain-containing protein [Anaerolineales bacterium]